MQTWFVSWMFTQFFLSRPESTRLAFLFSLFFTFNLPHSVLCVLFWWQVGWSSSWMMHSRYLQSFFTHKIQTKFEWIVSGLLWDELHINLCNINNKISPLMKQSCGKFYSFQKNQHFIHFWFSHKSLFIDSTWESNIDNFQKSFLFPRHPLELKSFNICLLCCRGQRQHWCRESIFIV